MGMSISYLAKYEVLKSKHHYKQSVVKRVFLTALKIKIGRVFILHDKVAVKSTVHCYF